MEIYETVVAANLMTNNAAEQRRSNYPLDGSNPLNSVFGGFFTTGYVLRVSEECMNNLFRRDPAGADHPAQISAILVSGGPIAEMTAAIADFFDREVIGSLDDEFRNTTLRKYQLLDFDASGRFMQFLVDDLIKQQESLIRSSRLDADLVRASLYQNVLFGYYFRVAEELVGPGSWS
jgi:hypothetical protein